MMSPSFKKLTCTTSYILFFFLNLVHRQLSGYELSGSLGYLLSNLKSLTTLWESSLNNLFFLDVIFQKINNQVLILVIVQWSQQKQSQRKHTLPTPTQHCQSVSSYIHFFIYTLFFSFCYFVILLDIQETNPNLDIDIYRDFSDNELDGNVPYSLSQMNKLKSMWVKPKKISKHLCC